MATATPDEINRQISENLKKFRSQAKLTQAQVANHLGIAYQSYQKMENGAHSFRVFTLDRLALLYGCRIADFVAGVGSVLDPLTAKAQILMTGMSEADRDHCIRAILKIRHRNPQ